jgi:uncharacterized membrane protein YbhN (UPF0104 family)
VSARPLESGARLAGRLLAWRGGARLGRLLITLAVAAVAGAVLVWVAPPAAVIRQLGQMRWLWIAAAVALELGSCLSYVVVFRRFFPEPARPVARRIAWVAMGAGAILPGGNISSAAATGVMMRNHGLDRARLLERCGALLCLLTLLGFVVNGVAAALLLVGVGDGPHDLLRAGGPVLVSVIVLGAAWLMLLLARRLGPRAPLPLRGLGAALGGAWGETVAGSWRLLGATGFLLLDMGALWAACLATGHHIGVPAVLVAYCIGYLATLIPVPAGLGVLDSGLAGALVLYGLSPAASVSAVLVYHVIAIWVPGGGGLLAWVAIRRASRVKLGGASGEPPVAAATVAEAESAATAAPPTVTA